MSLQGLNPRCVAEAGMTAVEHATTTTSASNVLFPAFISSAGRTHCVRQRHRSLRSPKRPHDVTVRVEDEGGRQAGDAVPPADRAAAVAEVREAPAVPPDERQRSAALIREAD